MNQTKSPQKQVRQQQTDNNDTDTSTNNNNNNNNNSLRRGLKPAGVPGPQTSLTQFSRNPPARPSHSAAAGASGKVSNDGKSSGSGKSIGPAGKSVGSSASEMATSSSANGVTNANSSSSSSSSQSQASKSGGFCVSISAVLAASAANAAKNTRKTPTTSTPNANPASGKQSAKNPISSKASSSLRKLSTKFSASPKSSLNPTGGTTNSSLKSKNTLNQPQEGPPRRIINLRGKMQIKSIKARQIYDSRGNPTVEVDLHTEDGTLFRAAVPSGASTGVHEALELRDKEKANWHGKGVMKAVGHVNDTLGPAVVAKKFDVTQQADVDKFMLELDGTENKSKFGANAILGISLAVCKAGAHAKRIPLYRHIADLAGVKDLILPVPAFNVINGGSHAGNALAMQEFMILPTGASSFSEAMKMGSETFHHLKAVIKDQYGLEATGVGDEGGFAPNIENNKKGLDLIVAAIEKAGYKGKIEIGMDVAASEFYKDGKYDLLWKTKQAGTEVISGEQLGDVYRSYIAEYPIVSIEDPFDQDDWESWGKLTASTQIQIVGDDLTVTNPKRIASAVEKKSCNALLLKVNQIGTVTESIEAHNLAKSNGWGTMISHRSGETEDTFIADLTVGLSTGQIKTGAPCRSERLAKYNQILRIEEELGPGAKFAGKNFRHPLKN